jgi:predicted AlkP superfamily pyrophosphatase or phosphodiesterase
MLKSRKHRGSFSLRVIAAGIVALVATVVPRGDARPFLQLPDSPRLLLFITIDQARYDYFVRFRPLFQVGLKTLLDRGVLYTNAHHNHATTATAPGHASLASGLHPARSGMVGNDWYDRESEEEMYSVQDVWSPILPRRVTAPWVLPTPSSSGRSPRNLLGSTLADWMKEQNPRSKLFAAGGKDRSAITVGGKNADAVYWYNEENGSWVTSRYYLDAYPEWVSRFHSRTHADAYFGHAWEPLPVDPSTHPQLGIERSDRGIFRWQLPHPLGEATFLPDEDFYTAIYESPFIDSYLVAFAKALIEGESLGQDADTDFLALCFAAVDTVGHTYGPHSEEVLDTLLRLDRSLGELFDYIDERVGMDRVVVGLSADHGVMPLPESAEGKSHGGRRFDARDVTCYQGVERQLDAKFGEEDWLLYDLYINFQALGRRNLRRQDVENELARILAGCDSIARVWTRTQLESPPRETDAYFERFVNSFHPQRSPDVLVQLKPFHTSELHQDIEHGSAYPYDSHVPFIILAPGIPPTVVAERVNTVDFAPTLAWLLGVPTPEDLDGVARNSWWKRLQTPTGK